MRSFKFRPGLFASRVPRPGLLASASPAVAAIKVVSVASSKVRVTGPRRAARTRSWL